MEAFEMWVRSTELSRFVTQTSWVWPASETLHFMGLCLLVGMIGLFDLRLLGMAKSIPVAALHRLIPWGIFGYVINVLTGTLFFFGAPDQYMYNNAFRLKLVFMFMAGMNVLVFYLVVFKKVRVLGPGEDAPIQAKVIAAVSVLLWIGVMTCGRLLTFFRPPFIR